MATSIVDTAERIVASEGLSALTMQRLGAELGYRAGALYRYHASKDAVIAALIGRLVDAMSQAIAAAEADAATVARSGASAGDAALLGVAAVLRAYIRLAEERPSLMGLLGRFLADPAPVVPDAVVLPEVVPLALATIARVVAVFASARAIGALSPGDDAMRAAISWNALFGLTATRKLARFGLVDPDKVARETVRTLLVGFGAGPGAAARAVDAAFVARETS